MIYIDQSCTYCKYCGAPVTYDGRIPDEDKKHVCKEGLVADNILLTDKINKKDELIIELIEMLFQLDDDKNDELSDGDRYKYGKILDELKLK